MFSVEVEIVLYLGIFLNFPTVFLNGEKNYLKIMIERKNLV